MASSWFLILLLKCIDFLSWPVLALFYPLCASIEAIESESHAETWNLISYWILLSLIYLFEYAFPRLLQWFQYWHYMKLMMVAFLVIPDFGRAAYVYSHLIKSCIYMNPQAVISRFRSWKNIFAKKEGFIMQAEKYIPQNGTETFEKLLASKNTEQSISAETRKAVLATTEKNEILKANAALDRLKSNESCSSAIAKSKKMAADKEHGKYAHISASENVQEEWTCAICQLIMPSEANLNSHLQGRKHKAACEPLNTKTNATTGIDIRNEASPQVSACIDVQKIWTCGICQVILPSFPALNSHLQGKKHKAACEALNTKTNAAFGTDTRNEASPQVSACINVQKIWTCGICQVIIPYPALNSHLQGKEHEAAFEALNTKTDATTGTDTRIETSPQVSACINVQKIWTCGICQVTIPAYPALNAHLQGKEHKAACEALNTKTNATAGTETRNEASSHVSACINVQKIWTCGICRVIIPSYPALNSHLQGKEHKAACETLNTKTNATAGTEKRNEASPQVSACINVHKIWSCGICQVTIPAYPALNSHLQGKKHKAACEALNTKTEGTSGTDTGNGASSLVYASTNVRKFWTCDICKLTMLEGNMSSHLRGKKHKATCEALNVKSQLVA